MKRFSLRAAATLFLTLLLGGCGLLPAIPIAFGVTGAVCVGELSGVLNTALCSSTESEE